MNDNFLYTSRPPVRKEFADHLYQHLCETNPERDQQGPGEWKNRKIIKWNYALISIVIIFLLLFTFSDDVRAFADRIIQNVAGFFVEERTNSPMDEIEQTTPGVGSGAPFSEITEVFIPAISLEDLVANPPFQFELPSYLPEGFELQRDDIAKSGDWVSIVWEKQNAEIVMLVEQSCPVLPVGPDSTEEIVINGNSALLIRGWWGENHVWDPTRGLEIHWNKSNLHYRLIYSQRTIANRTIEPISGDIDQLVKELIQIAESVP
ncbi:MAG TPA: hypothetical protein DD636_04875 [Anaerolineaceae bacterium]|nr:hypothetical protein [Anaerolineaceae bacterium]